MITSKEQFDRTLKSIIRVGAELDSMIVQAASYAAQQSCSYGNHNLWAPLLQACPVYAQGFVKIAERESKKVWKSMPTEQRTEHEYNATVSQALVAKEVATSLEERRKAKEVKAIAAKAKKAPKPDTKPSAVVSVPVPSKPTLDASAKLISADGHEQSLNQEEYDALVMHLQAMRTKRQVRTA